MKSLQSRTAPDCLLVVPLIVAIALTAEVAGAQRNHVEPLGGLLLREHGHRPHFPESEATVSASPRCLEISTDEILMSEAAVLLENFPREHITAVSFICGPADLMPTDLMIGFTHFPDANCGLIAQVSAHRFGDHGAITNRRVFDQVTAGHDYRLLGVVGTVNKPWGFLVQRGCFYPTSTIFHLEDGTIQELGEWGGPILINTDGAVDLVWLEADGVHLHHTDPVVVWKLFRNAREPEIFGQQMSWTLVDDRPGNTIRILRDFFELQQGAMKHHPQAIP